ncbi:hypothetical protein [Kineococcus indalonis]|uniref:hypothetical protein n=1 Tax=Kineococcus indalonis TaxID=2696566 RepID=UPI0014132868|nr:hypothetical protein [Kineococcus indalonis]NAZ87232.1 hypothetical protein [Kineococcus indalonis]
MPRPELWSSIVLRAWVEDDGLRVRILAVTGSGQKVRSVTGSAEGAAAVVGTWLADLAAGRPLGGGPGTTGRPGVPPSRGS